MSCVRLDQADFCQILNARQTVADLIMCTSKPKTYYCMYCAIYCAYVCCIHIICSAVYMGGMRPWPCIIGPAIMAPVMPGIIAAVPGYINGFSSEYWWADVITELQ